MKTIRTATLETILDVDAPVFRFMPNVGVQVGQGTLAYSAGRFTHTDAEKRGLDAFGLDLSPGMVDHARRAHPALRFDEIQSDPHLQAREQVVTEHREAAEARSGAAEEAQVLKPARVLSLQAGQVHAVEFAAVFALHGDIAREPQRFAGQDAITCKTANAADGVGQSRVFVCEKAPIVIDDRIGSVEQVEEIVRHGALKIYA